MKKSSKSIPDLKWRIHYIISRKQRSNELKYISTADRNSRVWWRISRLASVPRLIVHNKTYSVSQKLHILQGWLHVNARNTLTDTRRIRRHLATTKSQVLNGKILVFAAIREIVCTTALSTTWYSAKYFE